MREPHRQRARRLILALAAQLLASGAYAGTSAAATPQVSASASAAQIPYGAAVTVSGRATSAGQGSAGAALALQASAYPAHGFVTVARVAAAADGSFSFSDLRPDRNSRLRVLLESVPAAMSPELAVVVDPAAALHAVELGPGRTRLSLRLSHAPRLSSGPVSAWWYVAPRHGRRFRLAAVTSTHELTAGLTYASVTIDPPLRRFSYRVCLNPLWEGAMGPTRGHHACPQHDFTARRPVAGIEYEGRAHGAPLPPYPPPGAIEAAARLLDTRAGRTAFAVVDSRGRLSGLRVHEHFQTASVVKVMMLVAYLQRLAAEHRELRAADNAILYPMIHVSDNSAASRALLIAGPGALARLAHEAGMTDYAPGVGWWAFTQTSAADQARFLFALDRLVPSRFYDYARALMSGIEPSQSWGIPPVARPRWQVFFKTGQLPEEGLFNEVARLERGGLRVAIAVLTTSDPSTAYGQETIRGVAAALLERTP
jgi:hypothetical protein